ncbi:hypothetical protein [Bifidobacterium vansinderenii]|uniref:Uncharacterized protein n=1 Tax=Bifidobacterium vansinderenii TaxID=1984871 RepID=A0A229VXT1_9BIFI|nr:hypothetical protein [Bifidobacterium vansinderenii]OXN00439.1 hypothetical protein Tam10B_1309 [Bifidobacterium vansinderenii]
MVGIDSAAGSRWHLRFSDDENAVARFLLVPEPCHAGDDCPFGDDRWHFGSEEETERWVSEHASRVPDEDDPPFYGDDVDAMPISLLPQLSEDPLFPELTDEERRYALACNKRDGTLHAYSFGEVVGHMLRKRCSLMLHLLDADLELPSALDDSDAPAFVMDVYAKAGRDLTRDGSLSVRLMRERRAYYSGCYSMDGDVYDAVELLMCNCMSGEGENHVIPQVLLRFIAESSSRPEWPLRPIGLEELRGMSREVIRNKKYAKPARDDDEATYRAFVENAMNSTQRFITPGGEGLVERTVNAMAKADADWFLTYQTVNGINHDYLFYRRREGAYRYKGIPIEPFRDLVPLATEPNPAPALSQTTTGVKRTVPLHGQR